MIKTDIQIRFADCDMAGHVHNAAYLHYFESARINFFMQGLGKKWNWKKHGLILKKNTIAYHMPTFIEDKINVEVNCTHIGTKSFTLAYAVKNEANHLKAYGESVVVCFDYEQQTTVPIPAVMKTFLELQLID